MVRALPICMVLWMAARASAQDPWPPDPVTDLSVPSGTTTSITVHWTTPNDVDGTDWPLIHHFLLAVYTVPVTETNFDVSVAPLYATHGTATPCSLGEILYLRPQQYSEPGTAYSQVVPDLISGTRYYFAIRAFDLYQNFGTISNVASERPRADWIAPGTIITLAVTATTSDSATLKWKSSGDDDILGTAARYDLRYSKSGPIPDDGTFDLATPVPGEPTPLLAGTEQTLTVENLPTNARYYFAIRTFDEDQNPSELSNAAFADVGVIATPAGEGGSGGGGGGCGGSAGRGTIGWAFIMVAGMLPALRNVMQR